MAKKSGRGGRKDPLGKLLLTSGNLNPAILAGGAGVVAVGLVLAVVALTIDRRRARLAATTAAA